MLEGSKHAAQNSVQAFLRLKLTWLSLASSPPSVAPIGLGTVSFGRHIYGHSRGCKVRVFYWLDFYVVSVL